MGKLHPRIMASNEARIEARLKEPQYRARDLLWITPLIAASFFSFQYFPQIIDYAGLAISVLLLITFTCLFRASVKERRIRPHRIGRFHLLMLASMIVLFGWSVIGLSITIMGQLGLI